MKTHIESTYKLDKTSLVYFTQVKGSSDLINLVVSRANSIQTVCLNKVEFAMLKVEMDKWSFK